MLNTELGHCASPSVILVARESIMSMVAKGTRMSQFSPRDFNQWAGMQTGRSVKDFVLVLLASQAERIRRESAMAIRPTPLIKRRLVTDADLILQHKLPGV
jgi:hypothetical protein